MMLRSAEADPHVIERVVHANAEASVGSRAGPTRPEPAPKRRPGPRDRATDGVGTPRSAPTPAQRPKTPFEVHRGRSLGAAESGDAPHPPKRVDAGPSNQLQSDQLQGLAPLTSPLTSCCRCQQRDARSFHGLCSPSRSLVFRSDPTVPWSAGAYRAEARRRRALRPSRRTAVGWWAAGIPLQVLPHPAGRSPWCAAPSGAEAEPRADAFSASSRDPDDATFAIAPPKRSCLRGPVPGRVCPVREVVERVPRCRPLRAAAEALAFRVQPREAFPRTFMGFSTSKIAPRSNLLGRTRALPGAARGHCTERANLDSR